MYRDSKLLSIALETCTQNDTAYKWDDQSDFRRFSDIYI